MKTIARGFQNVTFIVNINLDRFLTTATVIGSLYFSAYILLA